MAKHGKKYRSAAEKIDSAQLYTPRKAVTLVKEVATANFDETIEAHFRLGVDTRKADQNIRGSISMDVAKMVSELKAGRVEYRADRYGICHVPLGKKSFSDEQLVENYAALYTEILRVKPASAKGKYVKSISVSSTMGPGVKVDPAVQRNFLAE